MIALRLSHNPEASLRKHGEPAALPAVERIGLAASAVPG
jgi:hypothetical protein